MSNRKPSEAVTLAGIDMDVLSMGEECNAMMAVIYAN